MPPPSAVHAPSAYQAALAEVERLEAELRAARRRVASTAPATLSGLQRGAPAQTPHPPPSGEADANLADDCDAAALVAAMPVPAWIKDADGRHLVANEALEKLFEVPPGGLLGLGIDDLRVPPAEMAELKRHDAEARETGQPFCGVERLSNAAGERRAWHVSKFPLPARPGEPSLWAGFAADITDAFRYEEQLEMALDAGGGGTWSWVHPADCDPELRGLRRGARGKLHMDPRGWQMLGLPPEPGPEEQEAWESRLHPDDRMGFLRALARLLSGEEQKLRREVRVLHADGSWRWVESVGRALSRDAAGRPLHLVGLHLDIHRRKLAEAQTQRHNQKLRDEVSLGVDRLEESEERFVSIAHSSPLMLWLTHEGKQESGGGVWLNPALEAFLGSDESRGSARHVLREWIAGLDTSPGGSEPAALEREIAIEDARGEARWLLLHGRARHTRGGRFLGHVGTVLDVTEKRKARVALESSKSELEEAVEQNTAELRRRVEELANRNRELDHFAHAASHDLRSPLRTITGFAGFLSPVVAGDPEAADFLNRIQRASMRMAMLLDSLLAFASVGRGELQVREVDLNVVSDEVLEDLADAIDRTHATIEVRPLPRVFGDETMLRQALQNLLGNALKYSGENPPKVRVKARIDPADPNRCVVTVADAGIGFADSAAEHLFTPFRRFHQEEAPGSGVGLSIVRRVAERHGGRVWAERLETGELRTRFHMELRTAEL